MIDKLVVSGLTENEAHIYLALLHAGQQSLSGVTKILRLDRSSVYRSLMSLVERGLAEYEPKIRGSLYRAKSPKSLNYLVREREESTRIVQNVVKDVIQELDAAKNYPSLESNTIVLEGPRVIEEIWEDMLREDVESQRQLIRCDVQDFLINQHGINYHREWVTKYIKRRVARKMPLKYLTKKEWFNGEFTSSDPKLFKEVDVSQIV
jgi:sugar-specific transcriptional regulator TrmB